MLFEQCSNKSNARPLTPFEQKKNLLKFFCSGNKCSNGRTLNVQWSILFNEQSIIMVNERSLNVHWPFERSLNTVQWPYLNVHWTTLGIERSNLLNGHCSMNVQIRSFERIWPIWTLFNGQIRKNFWISVPVKNQNMFLQS